MPGFGFGAVRGRARRRGSGLTAQGLLIASMNAAGGQSALHDYRLATVSGVPEFLSADLTANGNDHYATAAGTVPTVGAGGATFDANDSARQAISGGTFTCVISFTPGALGTAGRFFSDQGGSTAVIYSSSNTSVLTAPVYVYENGVGGIVATRKDLYDAMVAASGEVVIMATGLDFTADTELLVGHTTASGPGVYRKAAIIDEVTHAATLAADRALALEALAA